MRVYCTACDSKGKITSREQQAKTFAKLYCLCLNAKCGHTWVAHLTFSHSIREPVRSLDTLLLDHLRDLPAAQKQLLFDQLGKTPAA